MGRAPPLRDRSQGALRGETSHKPFFYFHPADFPPAAPGNPLRPAAELVLKYSHRLGESGDCHPGDLLRGAHRHLKGGTDPSPSPPLPDAGSGPPLLRERNATDPRTRPLSPTGGLAQAFD